MTTNACYGGGGWGGGYAGRSPPKKDETPEEAEARIAEERKRREYVEGYHANIRAKELEFKKRLDKCTICQKHHCGKKCSLGFTCQVGRSTPWGDPGIRVNEEQGTMTIHYYKGGDHACTHGPSIQCEYKGERTVRQHIPNMVHSMITPFLVRDASAAGSVFQDAHSMFKGISKGIHEKRGEAKERLIDLCVNITNRACDEMKASLEKVIREGADGLGTPSFLRDAVIEELGEFPQRDRRGAPRLFGERFQ